MTFWRMAFRQGNKGPSLWQECQRYRVAAITYYVVGDADLTTLPVGEPDKLWAELFPAQKVSLKRLAYEMQGGDVIYVKDGPRIIGRGMVRGRRGARAYKFDRSRRITDLNGRAWRHQVPVDWSLDFAPVSVLVGRSQQYTVEPLSELDVRKIESVEKIEKRAEASSLKAALLEGKYYRESPAQQKLIIPRHNRLSNAFRRWLHEEHQVNAAQEREQVDIRFELDSTSVLAELEVCLGRGTRRAIREAIGQLLEYNHYPGRSSASEWLLVLDECPSELDFEYLRSIRHEYSLPVFVGWKSGGGFAFQPKWPC